MRRYQLCQMILYLIVAFCQLSTVPTSRQIERSIERPASSLVRRSSLRRTTDRRTSFAATDASGPCRRRQSSAAAPGHRPIAPSSPPRATPGIGTGSRRPARDIQRRRGRTSDGTIRRPGDRKPRAAVAAGAASTAAHHIRRHRRSAATSVASTSRRRSSAAAGSDGRR